MSKKQEGNKELPGQSKNLDLQGMLFPVGMRPALKMRICLCSLHSRGQQKPNPGGGIKTNCSSHCGNSIEDLQKTRTRVAIGSSNPMPGHISRQNCNSKRSIPLCSQQPYLQWPRCGSNLNVQRQMTELRRGV